MEPWCVFTFIAHITVTAELQIPAPVMKPTNSVNEKQVQAIYVGLSKWNRVVPLRKVLYTDMCCVHIYLLQYSK